MYFNKTKLFTLFLILVFVGCSDSVGPSSTDSQSEVSFLLSKQTIEEAPGSPDEVTVSAFRPSSGETVSNPAKSKAFDVPAKQELGSEYDGKGRVVSMKVPTDADGDDYKVGLIAYGTQGPTSGAVSFGAISPQSKTVYPRQVTVFDLRDEKTSLVFEKDELWWKEPKNNFCSPPTFPEYSNVDIEINKIDVQLQNGGKKKLEDAVPFLQGNSANSLEAYFARDLLAGPNVEVEAKIAGKNIKTEPNDSQLDWGVAALRSTNDKDGYFPIQLRFRVASEWQSLVTNTDGTAIDGNGLSVVVINPVPTGNTADVPVPPSISGADNLVQANEVEATWVAYCGPDNGDYGKEGDELTLKAEFKLLESEDLDGTNPLLSTDPF